MADQNLFERYGIKEVADVTFYRIEKKSEVYETQRDISVSSILKGAIETKMVYPLDENGAGEDEGFEAYVFTGAEILSRDNFDCDVIEGATGEAELIYTTSVDPDGATMTITEIASEESTIGKEEIPVGAAITNGTTAVSPTVNPDGTSWSYKTTVEFTYNADGTDASVGTHEYSYEEQALMLFAKKQNLIKKTGVRYTFAEDGIFGSLTFNDNFTEAPNSTEKVVVLGLGENSFDENSYVIEDINTAIEELTSKVYKAKAYNVVYKDYAELIVDDEMGYFNPSFLAAKLTDKTTGAISELYSDNATITKNAKDPILVGATMWKENEQCLSINDAIEALRKKKKALDQSAESTLGAITKISGGYDVTDDLTMNENDATGVYSYAPSDSVTSEYKLSSVLEALSTISAAATNTIEELSVTDNGEVSNRAIYVKVNNVDTAASSYIYLLRNVNYKKLSLDKAGTFSFTDRNGNTVYYRDSIFAGIEYLALVVIGTKGLIFRVGRHGVKKNEKIAWMINDNGYVTDKQAEKIVENGLIHTIDIDVEDETFEATCSVSGIKIRKITKQVSRYVPVLFLDTLKVSTLEQTAEQTAATGGKGNGQLIIWDYGKEITLTLQDALYSPASMSAMLGSYEGSDFTKGVKDTKRIDRTERCTAERSFIVPAGNSKGVPSEGDLTAQAVYIELATMQPYQDGAPIAEGETFLKWTRSIAYGDNSLGNTIEISADKFPGTYKVVGDTFSRNKSTGEDQRFQFVIPQAKMSSATQTITLEAEGDPTVFDMSLTVLRPDDGKMVKLIQYDVVENVEEKDGSTMVSGTENLNLLDDAEMFKVSDEGLDNETLIGATEY